MRSRRGESSRIVLHQTGRLVPCDQRLEEPPTTGQVVARDSVQPERRERGEPRYGSGSGHRAPRARGVVQSAQRPRLVGGGPLDPLVQVQILARQPSSSSASSIATANASSGDSARPAARAATNASSPSARAASASLCRVARCPAAENACAWTAAGASAPARRSNVSSQPRPSPQYPRRSQNHHSPAARRRPVGASCSAHQRSAAVRLACSASSRARPAA